MMKKRKNIIEVPKAKGFGLSPGSRDFHHEDALDQNSLPELISFTRLKSNIRSITGARYVKQVLDVNSHKH